MFFIFWGIAALALISSIVNFFIFSNTRKRGFAKASKISLVITAVSAVLSVVSIFLHL